MPKPHDALHLPRPPDGGPILRRATPADVDALAAFNSRVHQDEAALLLNMLFPRRPSWVTDAG
jgi:hypothetical protein